MATEADPFAGLRDMQGELFRTWERGMRDWWDRVLDSDDVLSASADALAGQRQARGAYEASVDDTLARLHLPSRADLTRLARIASLLEDRVLALEDQLAEVRDQLTEARREALQARIEAAEARLELRNDAVTA